MEEQKLLKRKQKALRETNQILLASTCISLAELYMANGRYEFAVDEFKIVADTYKNMNKLIDYARANRMIGEAYTSLRKYDKALYHQEIHLNIAKQQNHQLEQQRALATIGHTCLTQFLNDIDTPNNDMLNLAKKSFVKSLKICQKLTGISQIEHKDMSARLFANLGIIEEYLGSYNEAIKLVEQSIDICNQHDLFEQLERGYTILGSLYNRKGEYSKAIQQYNLAVETAKRLSNKVSLTSASLTSKAEILIKLADFNSAKYVLLKAWKLKHPNDMETIEQNLKILAAMCTTQQELLSTDEFEYKKRKKLYEKMGDGACELKNFSKAIEYYLKMLEAAKNNGDSSKELSPCYVSLAQTYRDNKQYDLAIKYFQEEYKVWENNLKEGVNTLYNIADTLEAAGMDIKDVEKIYEQANENCRKMSNIKLMAKTLKRHITFLKKHKKTEKIVELHEELCLLGSADSNSESEASLSDEPNTPNIGEDICIKDLTDVSDESDSDRNIEKPRTTRNKSMKIQRNNKGETKLHTACISGKLELVQRLIAQGHVVNVRDNCGWLPIHEACNYGHTDIVRILLNNGASINDRGGMLCKGVTPLHDASSNGHLEVIKLMLDRGASPVAKTDDGETPLHYLKHWRTSVQLDTEKSNLYESIVKRMEASLKKLGHDKDVALDRSMDALVNESEEMPRKRRSTDNKQNTQQTKKTVVGSLRNTIKYDDFDLPSTSKHKEICQSLSHSNVSSSVTDDYKRTMESLRNRSTSENYDKKRKSFEEVKKSALLESNEVGDDWLEDDLGITSNKKRKTNTSNDFLNTYGSRRPSFSNGYNSEEGRKLTRKLSTASKTSRNSKEEVNIEETLWDFDFDVNEILMDKSENQIVEVNSDSSDSIKFSNKNKKKSQISLLDAGFSRNCNRSPNKIQNSTNSILNKRKHQVKLTHFGESSDCRENNSISLINSSINSRLIKEHMQDDNKMLSIDVKINDRLYRVPVSLKDSQTKTIKWLAEEASKRYYRKEYMKPTLELETKNGAILADDDLINLLFPHGSLQAEEIQAKVIKWDLPQLAERYKEACANINEVPDMTLLRALQETTNNLDISDLNLRCTKLLPFCKAINRQNNLHHLNLSGNFMTTECMSVLCSSLTSLENLVILNLSLNHLNAESIKYLSDAFINTNKSILENLNVLDLSYNPLSNECLKYMAIITRHLKLQTLNLCSVDFTSDIFDYFYNKNVELYLEYVEHFNISNNELNGQNLLKFISWLTPSKLIDLDVSNNKVQENGFLRDFTQCLANVTGENKLSLKKLNIARCAIIDSDIFDLLGILSLHGELEQLDVSYNEKLTAITLRRLLQHYPSLQIIELHGCDDILKFFDLNMITSDNFKRLKHLSLSIDYKKDKTESETLISLWRSVHDCNSVVMQELRNFLLLSISD